MTQAYLLSAGWWTVRPISGARHMSRCLPSYNVQIAFHDSHITLLRANSGTIITLFRS